MSASMPPDSLSLLPQQVAARLTRAGIYECIREMYGTPWEGIYSTQARGREINESGVFL